MLLPVLFASVPGLIAVMFFYLSYIELRRPNAVEGAPAWQWRFLSPALAASVAPLSLAAQRSAVGKPTTLLLTPVLLFVPYLIVVLGGFRSEEVDRMRTRLRIGGRFLGTFRVQSLIFLFGLILIAYSSFTVIYEVYA